MPQSILNCQTSLFSTSNYLLITRLFLIELFFSISSVSEKFGCQKNSKVWLVQWFLQFTHVFSLFSYNFPLLIHVGMAFDLKLQRYLRMLCAKLGWNCPKGHRRKRKCESFQETQQWWHLENFSCMSIWLRWATTRSNSLPFYCCQGIHFKIRHFKWVSKPQYV